MIFFAAGLWLLFTMALASHVEAYSLPHPGKWSYLQAFGLAIGIEIGIGTVLFLIWAFFYITQHPEVS